MQLEMLMMGWWLVLWSSSGQPAQLWPEDQPSFLVQSLMYIALDFMLMMLLLNLDISGHASLDKP